MMHLPRGHSIDTCLSAVRMCLIRGAAGVVGYTWGKHVDTNSGTFDRQIRGQKCHESRALHVYAIVCSENVIWMKGKH